MIIEDLEMLERER